MWKDESMILELNNQEVEIDDNLVPVILSLNNKGYRTQFCCEGHAPLYETYILFWNYYFDENIPDGFKKGTGKHKTHIYKTNRNENAKLEALKVLEKWADELDPYQ